MKKKSLYEYDLVQKERIKNLYLQEYYKCFNCMVKASEEEKESIIYIVPITNPYSSKWDYKFASAFIIKKLRKKMINVGYRKPNKIYISWNKKKKDPKESKEINDFLESENKKFIIKKKDYWKE